MSLVFFSFCGYFACQQWKNILHVKTEMSATVLERSMAKPFPTTTGFHVTSGFDVSASPCFGGFSTSLSMPQPMPMFNVKVPVTPPAATSTVQQKQQQLQETGTASKREVTATPTNADQLGWKGLLEISRNSGASGVLGCRATDEEDHASKDAHIEICCTAHTSPSVRRLVKSVIRGLKACQEPEKTMEGMGGTYFFMNENGRKVAILKPCDEEPLAPNNPKGYVGRALGDPGWKPTVRVGEAAMREVAAYLLDHEGFAKVPTSVLVRARHPIFCYNNRMSSVRASSLDLTAGVDAMAAVSTGGEGNDASGSSSILPMKLGSLQEFVYHECDTSEMGPSRFSVRDVHRIGILDIRLFNTDRHAGNMLVRIPRDSSCANLKARIAEGQYELIPIDHGFCLPETLEAPYFEWLHWPQAMLPFSEEELAYIRRLDVEADKELLRKELPNLRPDCLRVMELTTMLLKRGAEAGLTLFEIASIMTRPFEGSDEDPSDLEKFASYARHAIETVEMEDDTIVEEDSDDGIEEDDDLDADIDGEIEMANVEASGLGGNSSREDESMMFDLEEDATARGMAIKRRSGTLEAHSPSGGSIESSSMSSGEHLSFGTPRARMALPPGADASNGIVTPAGAAVPITQFASSVHVTDGFLWRRMKGKQAQSVKRHAHRKRPTSKLSRSPQAYPPHVMAFAPDSLNGLFSDMAMDEKKWAKFLEVIEDSIGDAIKSGKWRQAPKDNTVAMSCPRF